MVKYRKDKSSGKETLASVRADRDRKDELWQKACEEARTWQRSCEGAWRVLKVVEAERDRVKENVNSLQTALSVVEEKLKLAQSVPIDGQTELKKTQDLWKKASEDAESWQRSWEGSWRALNIREGELAVLREAVVSALKAEGWEPNRFYLIPKNPVRESVATLYKALEQKPASHAVTVGGDKLVFVNEKYANRCWVCHGPADACTRCLARVREEDSKALSLADEAMTKAGLRNTLAATMVRDALVRGDPKQLKEGNESA